MKFVVTSAIGAAVLIGALDAAIAAAVMTPPEAPTQDLQLVAKPIAVDDDPSSAAFPLPLGLAALGIALVALALWRRADHAQRGGH